MPKVGDKHFSYDAEGMKRAQEYSAKTGIPMEVNKRYNAGGLIYASGHGLPGRPYAPRGVGKAVKGFRTRGLI